MNDLISIIQSGNANVKLEVSSEHLLSFSNELINRAKSELLDLTTKPKEDNYLTKGEVKSLCNVCDATLWHWNKRGYLKHFKVGNKVFYRQSDLDIIMAKK